MTGNDRRRSRVRALFGVLDVVDFVSGSRLRYAGGAVVMVAAALVGFAILLASLGLAAIVIVVLGLSQGPYAWLGTAVLWTGVIGGFAAAAIVMRKIVRRLPDLAVVTGFAEPDDSAPRAGAPGPSPLIAPREAITPERLRALDSRLSSPTQPGQPAVEDQPGQPAVENQPDLAEPPR
jgi:hypothetical protein